MPGERVAVFGAGGQLGFELVRVFRDAGFAVEAHHRASVELTDAASVDRAVAACADGFAINAAAYNQVDLAEQDPQSAFRNNALVVQHLAVACRRHSTRMVHFSTDYVFDGEAGRPYTELDSVHPIGAYAVSKLAGELYAQAYLDDCLILRTSGVFGIHGRHTNRGNFPELMLRLAAEGKPVRVVEDYIASPTYAPAMAERTLALLEKGATGVFHLGGGEPVSWYRYAAMIFAAAGVSADLRATNASEYKTAARRPRFSALSNGKMEALGVAPMPPLQQAVDAYLAARAADLLQRASGDVAK